MGAASAINAGIQTKIHGSGVTRKNGQYIDKTLEDSGILLKVVTKTIEHEEKKNKEDL